MAIRSHLIRIAALVVSVIALFGAGTGHAWGDIYKFVDRHGHVHLSDRPLGPGYRLILRSRKSPTPPSRNLSTRNRQRFARLIASTAHKHGLETALVEAVVAAESAYDPDAVSRAGAVGLMQLMPATARAYGVKDRRNPAQNVDAGTRHLRDLLTRFRSLPLALAAYNAGAHAVAKHGNQIPPYRETRTYVRRVLNYYHTFRRSS